MTRYPTSTLFLSLAILLIPLCGKPQIVLGWQSGVSSNHLVTNIANREATVMDNRAGWMAGAIIRYRLKNWLYVAASPGLLQKNYSVDRTGVLLGVYERYDNTYIQLPLSAHIEYGRRLQVFSDVGIYLAYWALGRVKGRVPDVFSVADTINAGSGQQTETFGLTGYDRRYSFSALRDRRWEWGWVMSVGLQYRLGERWQVFAAGSYYQAMVDHQKKYMIHQIPQYNETLVFSLGGTYALGR
jgi:hypothetical protein